jgi:hypothetical protein
MSSKQQEVKVAIPVSAIGYGVNEATLKAMMAFQPEVLAADAGSTDSGPYYLGAGKSNKARIAVKRDLRLMLQAGLAAGIPVIVGNAGTSGARANHDWMAGIVEEIAREEGLSFRAAYIYSDIDPSFMLDKLRGDRVTPMPGVGSLQPEKVTSSARLVAQMGVEPFLRALDGGAQVILAGRACDSAIIGAYPIWKGLDHSLALHMGKVTECGAMCAWPATGRDGIFATVRERDFDIRTMNPARGVTPFSVAAHMVYESEHPYVQEEPEGTQDFSEVTVEVVDEKAVRVSGTKFTRRDRPTIKVEGSTLVGYRSFFLGGNRDPWFIAKIDEVVKGVTELSRKILEGADYEYEIDWKIYGRDAVMGVMEPNPSVDGAHEIGVLVQALAPTQEQAHDVATVLEGQIIGFSAPGSKTRTANIAFPFSPLIVDAGPSYRFEVFHIVELDGPDDFAKLFPIEFKNIG